jgi:hypothetical protein
VSEYKSRRILQPCLDFVLMSFILAVFDILQSLLPYLITFYPADDSSTRSRYSHFDTRQEKTQLGPVYVKLDHDRRGSSTGGVFHPVAQHGDA